MDGRREASVRFSNSMATINELICCILSLLQGYEKYGKGSSKWRKIQLDPDFSDIVCELTQYDKYI